MQQTKTIFSQIFLKISKKRVRILGKNMSMQENSIYEIQSFRAHYEKSSLSYII